MTPEKHVENHIRKTFQTVGGYIVKFFASPNTNKGVPDLLGCLAGRFIALEIKRLHQGKPTPVQLKNLQQIANAGGIALVTNDHRIVNAIQQAEQSNTTLSTVCQDTKIPLLTGSVDLNNLPTPTQARKLWQSLDGPHSLLILPHSNSSEVN